MAHPNVIAWDNFRARFPAEADWLEANAQRDRLAFNLLAVAQRDGELYDLELRGIRERIATRAGVDRGAGS